MLRLEVDSLRWRHRFEVATWVTLESVATWNIEVTTGLEALRGGLRSRHGWSRPGFLVSQPGNPTVGRNEVTT